MSNKNTVHNPLKNAKEKEIALKSKKETDPDTFIESVNISKFGTKLYKEMTSNFYDTLPEVCREYIANAIDANATVVELSMDLETFQNLEIKDNGVGMDIDTLKEKVEQFGIHQSGASTVGKFGIGLHSGTAVCENILIKSRSDPNLPWTIAKLPVAVWLSQAEQDIGTTLEDLEAIDLYSSIDNKSSEVGTIITLQNLNTIIVKNFQDRSEETPKEFINDLALIIPIKREDTDTSKEIEKLLDANYKKYNLKRSKTISVKFNGVNVVKTDLTANNGTEFRIDEFIIENRSTKEIQAIGFGYHSNQAVNPVASRGVRITKNGFTIIEPIKSHIMLLKMNEQKSLTSAQNRVIAEIEIINSTVQPVARRDDFEKTQNWITLKDKLANTYKNILQHRKASSNVFYRKDLQAPKLTKSKKAKLSTIVKKITKKLNFKETINLINHQENINKKTKDVIEKDFKPNAKDVQSKAKYKDLSNNPKKGNPKPIVQITNQNVIDFHERVKDLPIRLLQEGHTSNIEAYLNLYAVENYLREVTRVISKIVTGKDYIAGQQNGYVVTASRLSKSIQKMKEVEKRKRILLPRADNDIYYTLFTDLVSIYETNWDVFSAFIRVDLKTFKARLEEVETYRNRIAHGSKFEEIDLQDWIAVVKTIYNLFAINRKS